MARLLFRRTPARLRRISFVLATSLTIEACGYLGIEADDQGTPHGLGGAGPSSDDSDDQGDDDEDESGTGGQGGAATGGAATGGAATGGAATGGAATGGAAGGTIEPLPCDSRACSILNDALIHRYAFEGQGTELVDSAGDSPGFVHGTSLSDSGSLELSGMDQYVSLPSGMLASLPAVSFEVWFVWYGGDWWQRLFDVGSLHLEGSDKPDTYLYVTVHAGGQDYFADELLAGISHEQGQAQQAFCQTDESTPTAVLTQVVLVVDDANNVMELYRDGRLRARSEIDIRLSEINDEHAYLGHSLFPGDPDFHGIFVDFRMYDVALDEQTVEETFRIGPDATFFLDGP